MALGNQLIQVSSTKLGGIPLQPESASNAASPGLAAGRGVFCCPVADNAANRGKGEEEQASVRIADDYSARARGSLSVLLAMVFSLEALSSKQCYVFSC